MASTGFHSQSDKKSGRAAKGGLSPKDRAELDQPSAAVGDSKSAAQPLSPKEQADLDQIEAGLRDGDTAPEPQTPAPAESTPTTAPAKTPGRAATTPATKPGPSLGESATAPSITKRSPSPTGAATKSASPLPGGSSDRSLRGRAQSFLKRRIVIAFTAVIALLISLVLSFFALLPLKLTTITKTIEKHEVARIDDYVSHRIDAIIFRYLFQTLTGTVASDGYYTGSSIIRTVYGNLRLNNFEGKLKEKGITITKSGPNSISFVSTEGATPVNFNNADEFIKYMNTDLKGRQASKAIKLIVNDSYHPLQFLRRRHMRKYIMNAYNIRKWSIKKQEDKKDPNKPDLPGSTVLDVQSNVIDPPAELTASSIECVFGSPCPDPEIRNNPDGTSKFRPGVPETTHNGEPTAIDETKTGIRDSYKAIKESATKTLEAGLSKLVGPIITKTIFKAVPIIGWLALAADLDHFFWDGTLIKLGIMLHSAQYAAVAATWASLADQSKAGQLTASQINQLNTQLNDIEKSNAMQRIVFNSPDGGTKLADDKRVGSDDLFNLPPSEGPLPCDIGWLTGNIATNPPSGAAFWTFLYRQGMAFPIGGHTELCILHGALDTIAQFTTAIFGDLINGAFKLAIDAIDTIIQKVTGNPNLHIIQIAQDGLLWMMGTVWTPVVSGRETGAALGNAMDAGWDVTANQMCRDALGCKNISNTLAYEQQTQIAAETRADVAKRGLLASLFSTEPQTLGSQIIVMIPTTPDSAIDRLNTTALAMISSPFHFFGNLATSMSPSARAAVTPAREPNGVQQTGYDDTEMNDTNLFVATKDIAGPPGADGTYTGPDGRIDQYDCPQVPDASKPNQCLIDTAAAQVLCSSLSTNDDGGLGSGGTAGDCGDASSTPSAYDPTLNQYAARPSFLDHLQSLFATTFSWSPR